MSQLPQVPADKISLHDNASNVGYQCLQFNRCYIGWTEPSELSDGVLVLRIDVGRHSPPPRACHFLVRPPPRFRCSSTTVDIWLLSGSMLHPKNLSSLINNYSVESDMISWCAKAYNTCSPLQRSWAASCYKNAWWVPKPGCVHRERRIHDISMDAILALKSFMHLYSCICYIRLYTVRVVDQENWIGRVWVRTWT